MKKKKTQIKDYLSSGGKMLLSKSFLVAFFFAIALWAFNTMNDTYIVTYSIPLSIKVPKNRAIEGVVPEKIPVKLRGQGWNLFFIMNFNNTARCEIDLSKTDIADFKYHLTYSDILSGVQDMVNVEAVDVGGKLFDLSIGKMVEKKIPVIPDADIKTRRMLMLAGIVKSLPDSIIIRGNKKVVDSINSWFTEKIELRDVYKPFNQKVLLVKPLPVVTLSVTEVKVYADIQQTAEMCIYDVPITVRGGRLPRNNILLPEKITVYLRGGAKDFAEYGYLNLQSSISASINYADLNNDSVQYTIPKVKAPIQFTVIKTEPEQIAPVRIISQN